MFTKNMHMITGDAVTGDRTIGSIRQGWLFPVLSRLTNSRMNRQQQRKWAEGQVH